MGLGSLWPVALRLWSQSWYSVPGVKVMVSGISTLRAPISPVASCSGAPPGASRQAVMRVAPSARAVVERVRVAGVQKGVEGGGRVCAGWRTRLKFQRVSICAGVSHQVKRDIHELGAGVAGGLFLARGRGFFLGSDDLGQRGAQTGEGLEHIVPVRRAEAE